MKKGIKMMCMMACVALMVGCASEEASQSGNTNDADLKVIGISQYGQHGSLDNCREGFLEGLELSGLKEGIDFKVLYENAGFDDSLTTQIAQNFSAQNVDLMVGIATPSAVALYSAAEDKNIPVVFTAISDPKEAKLDGEGITGVSDKLPVEEQLKLIRTLQPEAKTIGIIYTMSEPNSISAIADYEALVSEYGFTLETIGITQQSEVLLATDSMISKKVDVISNLTDNTVVGVLPSILDKTQSANIPVYGSEVEQVSLGCIASAGIDYVKLGQQTGEMASLILKGEKDINDIPYETIFESEIYINMDVAKDLGITIDADILETAIQVES